MSKKKGSKSSFQCHFSAASVLHLTRPPVLSVNLPPWHWRREPVHRAVSHLCPPHGTVFVPKFMCTLLAQCLLNRHEEKIKSLFLKAISDTAAP